MALRLVMMGTGAFAVPAFRGLIESDHEVVGLFTQPERTGRGRHRHHRNPMKETAEEHGIAVFQPHKANAADSLQTLRELAPDLCVVAAYGQILSAELISIPRLGVINIHASLLPKSRGAAPVPYTILRGETETGVTVFQIVPELDAGPILGMEKTEVRPRETAGELEQRLAEIAVPLTLHVVDDLERGTARPVPQDAAKLTKAPRLKKAQGAIDWTRSAEEIDRHVRAMQPWPAAFSWLEQPGRQPLRVIVLEVQPAEPTRGGAPGTVLPATGNRLVVQAGEGTVEILRLKPAGKRSMTTREFLAGHDVSPGDRFTSEPQTG